MARESIISIASIASDQSSPALPKGWPLKRSSINPNGTPDQTGNKPGRISRQLRSISRPNGGNRGSAVKIGNVVTIDDRATEAMGMASILSSDCSRSKRLSYSRPGRVGSRMAVTGIFTPQSLLSCRPVRSLAALSAFLPGKVA